MITLMLPFLLAGMAPREYEQRRPEVEDRTRVHLEDRGLSKNEAEEIAREVAEEVKVIVVGRDPTETILTVITGITVPLSLFLGGLLVKQRRKGG